MGRNANIVAKMLVVPMIYFGFRSIPWMMKPKTFSNADKEAYFVLGMLMVGWCGIEFYDIYCRSADSWYDIVSVGLGAGVVLLTRWIVNKYKMKL